MQMELAPFTFLDIAAVEDELPLHFIFASWVVCTMANGKELAICQWLG